MTILQSLAAGLRPYLDPAANAVAPPISLNVLNVPPTPSFVYFNTINEPPGGFSKIYAFGDSLSDAGNISLATLHAVPTAAIYTDGHFTNGAVWVQDLAGNLHAAIPQASLSGGTDFAYGGAETGATTLHPANPSDLPSQLAQFDATQPHASSTALFTVWAGSNDVLDIANSTETPAQQLNTVQQAVSNETGFIQGLIAHGAKDLVVMGVPDLGKTPYELARPASDANSSALAQTYNAELGTALQAIVASGAASIDFVNTFALTDMAAANPNQFGLTNVTQPVWTGNLADPRSGVLNATGAAQNGYLYFDSLHPTATGHALLADAVTQSLTGVA